MTLDSEMKRWLTDAFGDHVRFDEPMSHHTSFQVGGPADALVAPDDIDQLIRLVRWAASTNIPMLVIGDGTNLLVRDGGIRGIVISIKRALNRIESSGTAGDEVFVTAAAGVQLHRLCRFAVGEGLAGLNFALGIPGTVGGAIRMNAGTAAGWISDVLREIRLLETDGSVKRIVREQLPFGYRELGLNGNGARTIILEGTFGLIPHDASVLKTEADRILSERKQRQPTHLPSAGCFFKNPPSGESAGRLIDQAGLKEKRIGGAEISGLHANFIVNRSGASAADILALVDLAQETVRKRFGIDLEPEVKIVGE